jgi:coproporphyrinogen III oxidase-like Fe-S oxidoreductase
MKSDLEIASKLDVQHLTYYPLYYYDEAILSKINAREDNIKQIYNFYDEVVDILIKN